MASKLLLILVCLALVGGAAMAQGGKKGAAEVPVSDAAPCGIPAFSEGAMTCSCPANAGSGPVWGSGPYTTDSDICSAARHAGVITRAGGVVRLWEHPGQASYSGSSRNGVNTGDWGSYGRSFAFDGAFSGADPELAACGVIPDGADRHQCTCPANPPQRSVWGSSPYTADSDICTAAVHSGYLKPDVGGTVVVLRSPGLAGYVGTESDGATSADWEAYPSSIIFDWNR